MSVECRGRISEETFDDFLASQGMLEDAEDVAVKRVLAWQLSEAMKQQDITKAEMAARMKTSRRQLDRLLDPGTHPSHLIRSAAPRRRWGNR